MKPLIFILVSFAWLTVISTDARGCSCIEYGVPVCAAYWRSDAVFAGQVLDITPVKKTSDIELPFVTLHFIVEQRFRGAAGNRVEVQTLHGTSCDMEFKKGKRYLVYASRDKESNQLFTGPCTRTDLLADADEDLNYLRTLTQQGAQESILGRLVHHQYEKLPGLKVTVQGRNKTLETKTDEDGNFSVPVPGPGTYKIRAFLPFAAGIMAHYGKEKVKIAITEALTTFEYEVQIAKNQCHFRQTDSFKIDLRATAEVSGSVLTESGRPVSPGYVYLVNAADPKYRKYQKFEEA